MNFSTEHVRNFVIIAHVDHGKSTLADRILEITGTVEARKMRPQYLDQLELERERGITIKMAPVRMPYALHAIPYTLNLIDTPGHSDFSYEVSRALAAVEGAVLLVDVAKGIQAQTLSNFRQAKKNGLTVIGAVNKIDLAAGNTERVVQALADLLGVRPGEILRVSGKTGAGVPELLEEIIRRVPAPKAQGEPGLRALVFDSLYDDHKGILAYVRVFQGTITSGSAVRFMGTDTEVKLKEIGYFAPQFHPAPALHAGEIGYIATGLKEPEKVTIGDTVADTDNAAALPGYREPAPVVFISFYPDAATKYEDLKRGFARLRLADAALSFEPEANEALGRGLKAGFLGQLHFEITASRLAREFGLAFLTSFPSIAYRVKDRGAWRVVKDAHEFPASPEEVLQPMIRVELLTPPQYLNVVLNLKNVFGLVPGEVKNLGESILITGTMPLSELIRDFDDQLKSVSAGYASFSYELGEEAPAEVEKLEILIAGEVVSALTRIVHAKDAEREARQTVERLKELLPREQFAVALQACVRGRIIARETIPALRKDVTGYLYGGDRTRKMKLWKKQKKGKEKLKKFAKVNIPAEVFREILKK